MKASQFLSKMFDGTTGNVILCTYANNRNEKRKYPPFNYAVRDWKAADEMLKNFDVDGRACYFSCATMVGEDRNKDSVCEIVSLYIDIDFKGVVETPEQIKAVLKKLKVKPSVVVESGNGLHCYWLLNKHHSASNTASCEALMRRICAKLAGDVSAAEIARILRLPGSHNSKGGAWSEVKVVPGLTTWKRYSYSEIDKYFEETDPLLTYVPSKRVKTDRNLYQEFAYRQRVNQKNSDIEEVLEAMEYGNTEGHGIDDSYTKVVGAVVRAEGTPEECIKILLEPARRAYEAGRKPGELAFSELRAKQEIRGKFRYFERKDAEAAAEEEANRPETLKPRTESKPAKSKDKPAKTDKDKSKGKETKKSKTSKTSKASGGGDYDFDPPDEDDDDGNVLNRIWSAPHDFWSYIPTERLRRGMLPEIIENVAFEYAERTGLDVDALAMSMLTVASSVITTNITVKAYAASDNKFKECLRLWQGNVGDAGAGKSPIMEAVLSPLHEIEDKLEREYHEEMDNYESHTKEEQKELDTPKRERTMLPNDSSVESVQTVFADNPHGVLGEFDELVGFFGAKSRYSNKGGGGEQTARGFWLSAYDSRRFSLTRMGRRELRCVPSCSIIGGIQPDVVTSLMDEASRNDGLVQRFSMVMMKPSMNPPKMDMEVNYPLTIYEDLIKKMRNQCPLRLTGAELNFSPKAAEVRDRMFEWVRDEVESVRVRNPQLAKHINKFSGMFLRFCGVYHMIENYSDKQPRLISAETANKVYRFLTSCRRQHAECFYGMLIENDENNDMRNIAEFILGHKLEKVSAREMQRGSGRLRRISTRDIAETAGNMVSLGWLYHIDGKRRDSFNWLVNPDVHELFKGRAALVKKKNAEMRMSIDDAKAAALKRAEEQEAQIEADDLPPNLLN